MLIDLTRLTTHGMPVYPGDQPPEVIKQDFGGIVDHRYQAGMHVGTHMDGPLHMVPGGKKLCELPVDRFVGPGVLVDARGKEILDVDLLGEIELGSMVLFWTDWEKKWGQEGYYGNYPVLTTVLAQELVKRGVKMIGVDSPSPDHEPYEVHRTLLARDILIVENLVGLEQLEEKRFDVYALPAKFDTDSAPVRVMARLMEI